MDGLQGFCVCLARGSRGRRQSDRVRKVKGELPEGPLQLGLQWRHWNLFKGKLAS